MRLIDADVLERVLMSTSEEELCTDCCYNVIAKIDEAPTVNVLQKLWNALYAEEDKFEKRYISTPEHDNWFLVYRPWLQNGFEIAINVLSKIFVSEPPKEGEK